MHGPPTDIEEEFKNAEDLHKMGNNTLSQDS